MASGIPLTLDILRRSAASMKQNKDESDYDFLHRVTHVNLNDKNIGSHDLSLLNHLYSVKMVYLYNNRLTSVSGAFRNCSFLTHLHLERNNLTSVDGIQGLPNLTKLFLDGNSISKVEGLEGCIQLEELHLSNQKVAPGHNLSIGNNTLHSLSRTVEVLNVEGSKVKAVSPFCILGQLKTLQAANNQLEHLDDLAFFLSNSIVTVADFSGNKVCKAAKYRDYCILRSNTLQILDGKDVDGNHRHFLHALSAKKQMMRQGGGGAGDTLTGKPLSQIGEGSVPKTTQAPLRPMPFEGLQRSPHELSLSMSRTDNTHTKQVPSQRMGFRPNARNGPMIGLKK